jgi:hypothetical protein
MDAVATYSTMQIQLNMLVYNKAKLIIISLKMNLYSPWYSRNIAELALTNNHLRVVEIFQNCSISWIYNYLCNQCPSPIKLWFRLPLMARCVLDTTLCDTVCQWRTSGRWIYPGTPVSSNNKTGRHDITEIVLKMALNTITLALTHQLDFHMTMGILTGLIDILLNKVYLYILSKNSYFYPY